jgi:hypothetical protein
MQTISFKTDRHNRFMASSTAILVLLMSTAVFAQTIYPEDGSWWSQDASGRGFLMERQGDTLFLTSFHYAADGTPEWLVAVGNYQAADLPNDDSLIGTYSATVYRNDNGQCIACDYVEPTEVVSSQSPLTIEFTSNQTAQISWPGESFAISRLFWNWQDALGQLDGQWIVASNLNGLSQARIANITSGSESAQVTDGQGALVGSIAWGPQGVMTWVDEANGREIPILVPENRRFYAGSMDAEGLQIVGVRIDDLPFAQSVQTDITAKDTLSQFTANVVIGVVGETLTITTDDLPNHNSPYWGVGSEYYEAPHGGMVVNPNRIQEQDITFRIPANPELATQITDTGLGPIGVSVNGVVFFNQYAGINMATGEFLPLDNEIQTFDLYNGHPQQTGQYHYHLEPFYLTVENTAAFIGFAMDGFPVYGPANADGSDPQLDECNGETHVTAEYPQGTYHYHASAAPPYLIGCFKGTPGTVSQ